MAKLINQVSAPNAAATFVPRVVYKEMLGISLLNLDEDTVYFPLKGVVILGTTGVELDYCNA